MFEVITENHLKNQDLDKQQDWLLTMTSNEQVEFVDRARKLNIITKWSINFKKGRDE